MPCWLAISALALCFLAGATSAQNDDPKIGSITQAIRGGNVITGYPGVVELPSCTGAMIGPNVAITAAHCIPGAGPAAQGSLTLGINYHDPDLGSRTVFNGTARWYVVSTFDSSTSAFANTNSDVAIIVTPTRFQSTNHEDYLRIFTGGDDFFDGSARIFGAGIFTYSGKYDTLLREHEFDIESVEKNHVVVDNTRDVNICRGDSGGPLVHMIAPTRAARQSCDSPQCGLATVAAVMSRAEMAGNDDCARNTPPFDDAYLSRTNWSKLEDVFARAGVTCDVFVLYGQEYRRCFALPFISRDSVEGGRNAQSVGLFLTAIR